MPTILSPASVINIGALVAPIYLADQQPFQQGQNMRAISNVGTRSLYGVLTQPRFQSPNLNTISSYPTANTIKRAHFALAADLAAGAALDVSVPGLTNAAYTALDAAIGVPGTTTPPTTPPTPPTTTPPTTPAKVPRVIVVEESTRLVLNCRGSDATLATAANGEFQVKTSSAGGNVITIKGKTTSGYKAGQVFSVFSVEDTDIVQISGGALAAGREYEFPAYGFLYAALAATEFIDLKGIRTP
jgi:hypothetical protein